MSTFARISMAHTHTRQTVKLFLRDVHGPRHTLASATGKHAIPFSLPSASHVVTTLASHALRRGDTQR